MANARLEANEVAVWYQQADELALGDLDAMSGVLSEDERARAGRFLFHHNRRDFIAAHALVRRVLSRYARTEPGQWRFDTSAHGKPSVVAAQAGTPPLAFSLSHTRGLVACAVARGTTLGIDVERIDRPTASAAIAARYFAPSEMRMLEACDAGLFQVRFIELWTLKESYIKAIGMGLAHGLDSCAFAFDGDRAVRLRPPAIGTADDWQFLLAAVAADYRMAVAVGRGTPRRQWRLVMRSASRDGDRARSLRRSTASRG